MRAARIPEALWHSPLALQNVGLEGTFMENDAEAQRSCVSCPRTHG